MPQLVNQVISSLLGQTDSFLVPAGAGRNPGDGGILDFLGQLLSLSNQGVSLSRVLHCLVLIGLGLHILVLPVLVAFEFLGEAIPGDKFLEVVGILGEVDLGGNYGVKPALDDIPDSFKKAQN